MLGAFALTISSFVACGDGEDGPGGTGGTGGNPWEVDLKEGWCESIDLAKVGAIAGRELELNQHLGKNDCSWGTVEAENYGGITVLVSYGDAAVFEAVREEMVKQGSEVTEVSGVGDKAYYMPGDEGSASSLSVLKGNRDLYISSHSSFSSLGSDALAEVAELVLDAI